MIRLPVTKCCEQADLEMTFFGNSQGEAVEFGADQCTSFIYDILSYTNPFYLGILVRNDAVRDRLQQRLGSSIIMSGLTFLYRVSG